MKSVITPKMFGAVFRNSGTIDQASAQQSIILKGNAAKEGGLALSVFRTTPGFHCSNQRDGWRLRFSCGTTFRNNRLKF